MQIPDLGHWPRFKPLAGIHSSATQQAINSLCGLTKRFKPLAGIHSSATENMNIQARYHAWVSNPSREFTPLQLGLVARGFGFGRGFQTPRGNSLLCNSSRRARTTSVHRVSNPSREFTPLQPGQVSRGVFAQAQEFQTPRESVAELPPVGG